MANVEWQNRIRNRACRSYDEEQCGRCTAAAAGLLISEGSLECAFL